MLRYLLLSIVLLLPSLARADVTVSHQIVDGDSQKWLLIIVLRTDDATGAVLAVEQRLLQIGGSQAPISVDKLVVLFIEEASERYKLSRGQLAVLSSTTLRDYIEQVGGEFRLADKDVDAARAEKWIQDGLTVRRESVPWMLVASPKGGVSIPLPDTVDKVREHVERYK